MSHAIRTLGTLCFCTLFGFLPSQTPAVDLAWSTYLSDPATLAGGYLEDMTLDSEGNILITGEYANDAVVFKLDASGSFLHWVYTFGGSFADRGKAITVGPDGSIYVVGRTTSIDFPVTPTAFQTNHGDGGIVGSQDLFVARIDPTGTSLMYASYYGGLGDDYPGDLDVNAAGDCFVGGYTVSGNIPVTPGAFDETFNGAVGYTDAFVFRTTPTFDQLTYSTFVGGSQSESVASIIVDENDEVTFSGEVNSPDFPVTPGAVFYFKTGSSAAAFMTRLSADGSKILASTFYSGNSGIYGEGMCLTPEGDAIIVGRSYASLMPLTPGSFDSTINGDADAFIIRISKDATVLQYATYYGHTQRDIASDVAINDRGEVFVTGSTASFDFPLSPCVRDSVWGGTNNYWGGDAFLIKLDSSMEHVLYSSYHGGSLDENRPVILLDGSSCDQGVILGMNTSSDDYPTTPGSVIDQWQSGLFMGVSRIEETLDVAIVSNALPCLVNGQPYPMAVTYNTCSPWSDAANWRWDLGDGRTLSDSAIAPAFTIPGTNTITVGLPGCPPAATLDLDLFAVELGPDLEVCAQANTVLTPNAPGAVSFWWQDGSTSPSHEVDRSGWVWVEVTNAQGCEARDSIQVDVIGEDDIIPPNAFTPNGDQINDVFFVTGMENQRFDLYVYDRWGKEVYAATPYNNDWGGSDLPEGVYYYSLTSPDRCGTYMNWVTLVR